MSFYGISIYMQFNSPAKTNICYWTLNKQLSINQSLFQAKPSKNISQCVQELSKRLHCSCNFAVTRSVILWRYMFHVKMFCGYSFLEYDVLMRLIIYWLLNSTGKYCMHFQEKNKTSIHKIIGRLCRISRQG